MVCEYYFLLIHLIRTETPNELVPKILNALKNESAEREKESLNKSLYLLHK